MIAVITGANRGIGKEVARQLAMQGAHVILTARNLEAARTAADEIGGLCTPAQLDVANDASTEAFERFLAAGFPAVDVLVNNAGITGGRIPMTGFDLESMRTAMETNFYGAMRVTRAVLPLLQRSSDARIINVSTSMAQFAGLTGGYAAYRLSKVALNGFTCLLANELADAKIAVNAVCPGWVRTDMGGPNAPDSIEQGADTIMWLATIRHSPTGKFFRAKKQISW